MESYNISKDDNHKGRPWCLSVVRQTGAETLLSRYPTRKAAVVVAGLLAGRYGRVTVEKGS